MKLLTKLLLLQDSSSCEMAGRAPEIEGAAQNESLLARVLRSPTLLLRTVYPQQEGQVLLRSCIAVLLDRIVASQICSHYQQVQACPEATSVFSLCTCNWTVSR